MIQGESGEVQDEAPVTSPLHPASTLNDERGLDNEGVVFKENILFLLCKSALCSTT